MPETTPDKQPAPRTRTRQPRKSAKAPIAKKPTASMAPEPFDKFAVDLIPAGITARFSKWGFPAGVPIACTGTLYFPFNTKSVRILVVPDSGNTDEGTELESI